MFGIHSISLIFFLKNKSADIFTIGTNQKAMTSRWE